MLDDMHTNNKNNKVQFQPGHHIRVGPIGPTNLFISSLNVTKNACQVKSFLLILTKFYILTMPSRDRLPNSSSPTMSASSSSSSSTVASSPDSPSSS